MTAKEIKSIGEIFIQVKKLRDREQAYRVKMELKPCDSLQDEVMKDENIKLSQAREIAFQEVLNIIMEKKQ